MNIVLPIIFCAVFMGLFVKRMTNIHWIAMASVISLVIAFQFLKH